jgi:hypothetical protein
MLTGLPTSRVQPIEGYGDSDLLDTTPSHEEKIKPPPSDQESRQETFEVSKKEECQMMALKGPSKRRISYTPRSENVAPPPKAAATAQREPSKMDLFQVQDAPTDFPLPSSTGRIKEMMRIASMMKHQVSNKVTIIIHLR